MSWENFMMDLMSIPRFNDDEVIENEEPEVSGEIHIDDLFK